MIFIVPQNGNSNLWSVKGNLKQDLQTKKKKWRNTCKKKIILLTPWKIGSSEKHDQATVRPPLLWTICQVGLHENWLWKKLGFKIYSVCFFLQMKCATEAELNIFMFSTVTSLFSIPELMDKTKFSLKTAKTNYRRRLEDFRKSKTKQKNVTKDWPPAWGDKKHP